MMQMTSYCYMMPINQNLFLQIGNKILLMLAIKLKIYNTFDVGNQSKPIFPYWKYNTFDVGMIDDQQSFINFQLEKMTFTLFSTFLIYPTE